MKAKQGGFTLLEMMIAISLLAILLSFGLPNFRDFIRNARLAAAANDVIADMNFARSEAIKRRVPVTLCKSDDAATCDDSTTSEFRGWIIFVDDADAAVDAAEDGDGAVDAGEVILRTGGIAPEIDDALSGTRLRSTFLSSGFVKPDAANLTQILFCDVRGNAVAAGGDSAARGITISATGRAVVTRNPTIIEDQLGGCP